MIIPSQRKTFRDLAARHTLLYLTTFYQLHKLLNIGQWDDYINESLSHIRGNVVVAYLRLFPSIYWKHWGISRKASDSNTGSPELETGEPTHTPLCPLSTATNLKIMTLQSLHCLVALKCNDTQYTRKQAFVTKSESHTQCTSPLLAPSCSTDLPATRTKSIRRHTCCTTSVVSGCDARCQHRLGHLNTLPNQYTAGLPIISIATRHPLQVLLIFLFLRKYDVLRD
jgi:hypothetical protein